MGLSGFTPFEQFSDLTVLRGIMNLALNAGIPRAISLGASVISGYDL
jgi:hypothetical protein